MDTIRGAWDEVKDQADQLLGGDDDGTLSEDARTRLTDYQAKFQAEYDDLKQKITTMTDEEKVKANQRLDELKAEIDKIGERLKK